MKKILSVLLCRIGREMFSEISLSDTMMTVLQIALIALLNVTAY